MPKLPNKPHKPNRRPGLALAGLVVLGFIAYVAVFLSQPSVLGFVDDRGNSAIRAIDVLQILLLESLWEAMLGGERLAVGWLDRLPILLAACGWLLLGWWCGRPWVQRALNHWQTGRLELHTLSVLTGLSFLSTLTLLVGLMGGLGSPWPLAIACGLLAAAAGFASGWIKPCPAAGDVTPGGGRPARGVAVGVSGTRADTVQPGGTLEVWLARGGPVLVIILAATYVLGSLMPPWEFDVIEYHLQAPKEFYQAGRISFLEHNVYANMPLAAEMHSLAAMTLLGGVDAWWWGGLVGKTICGLHSLIAALLLGGFVARHLGSWNGWVAAGLLLATPGNAHVAMAGLIDMVLAAYLLGALVVLSTIWEKRGSSLSSPNAASLAEPPRPPTPLVWFLVSQLAGAAAACKYPGLPLGVIPSLLVLTWLASQAGRRQVVGRSYGCQAAGAGLLGLSLSCFPWYAKNWALSGNPFFPLAYSLFGGRGMSELQATRWAVAHRVPNDEWGYSPQALWESLQQLAWGSPFLQPSMMFLFIWGVILAIGKRSRPQVGRWTLGWIAFSMWILAVWWLATHRIDRFWLPVLPIWAAVAATAAGWIGGRLSFPLASGIVLLGLLYGGFINASGALGDNRFFVSLHALRADVGSGEIPGRLPPAIGWVNATLAKEPENKLLLIGEAKAFDFQLPIVYATCFDTNPAETWLRDQSPARQLAILQAHGITHVMVNWSEIQRYRSPGNYGFSDWPHSSDIQQMIDANVVSPLETPFSPDQVQILAVQYR